MLTTASTATIPRLQDINDESGGAVGLNTVGYDSLMATLANLQLIFHISSKVACIDGYIDGYHCVYGTLITNMLKQSILM